MSARGWSNYTPESYMRDEEREDDARIAADWRNTRPAMNTGDRFSELGHRLIDSWWVLAPLGLMCVWAILDSAGVFKP